MILPNPSARPSFRLLSAVLLAGAVLSGCAPVATRTTAPTVAERRSPALAEARERAANAAALAGPERRANDEAIERLLSQLDNAELQRAAADMPAGDPLYDYAGRALLRRGLPLPRPFDRNAWKFDAAGRPAAERDGYRPPVKLAVLLPLTGPLATPAAPVRDGLLAAYYGESRRRPDIAFYDTAPGALAAYDRAVAAGSDFVVGPLGRDEVTAVFARGSLPVPVLALNRAPQNPPAGNASFSLSPEDEGLGAAEYLLSRGAKKVLVIASGDDQQQRAVASLRMRLAERGGAVTDVVGETTADFATLAAKDGGVDAVFLAVKGSAARALVPKLALAGLADKPRVATSQILSGTGKPATDSVLDGIAFPAETWTNRGLRGLPAASSVAGSLPTARGPAARLFAFGYDAWLLTAYLEHLATAADGRLDGATGVLRIDGFGNVQRTPAWSTFSSGVAVPLADAGR